MKTPTIHPGRLLKSLSWVILGACFLAGCASPPLWQGILPNGSEVAPGLVRCGQPTPEGFLWLVAHGYTNDVQLNSPRDVEAERAGMHVVYLPISTCQQLGGGPSIPTIAKAVAWMCQPGTVVHCTHGQDRTGLAIGVYRVWICHWSKQRAYAEMKAHGFHPMLKGLWDFWDKLPE